jgi:hypothetical protein
MNGVAYQKSLRDMGKSERNLPSYIEHIASLATRYKVYYRIKM